MDNVWLLLLLAGLAAGVVFVGGYYITDTPTVTPERTEPGTEREVPTDTDQHEYEGTDTEVVGEVENLDFKVDETTEGRETTMRFRVNQPGTDGEDVRIDLRRDDGSEAAFILRHGRDEGWFKDYTSEQWAHFSGYAFTQLAGTRAQDYSVYRVTDWEAMEGETFRMDTEDRTARVYDVRVNRGIPESVFAPD